MTIHLCRIFTGGMMNVRLQEIKQFFYSQHFDDGVRITLAVLLPSVIFNYFGRFDIGLTISLGALCVSLADIPGPIAQRKKGMLFCLFFIFFVAIETGFARLNIFTMGLEILLFCFFFSMFTVYGDRASYVGTVSILVMVLTMDKDVKPSQVIPQSLLILSGGLWYSLISLFSYHVRPYRTAQRALGESIRQLAHFLSIKADFYDPSTNMDYNYRQLVSAQMVVSEKQNHVRELLFKTRETVRESTPMGRKLVLAFIDTVDLFEEITATYYDYGSIRKQYGHSPILYSISLLIKEMATELDNIGMAIEANTYFEKPQHHKKALVQLKNQIDDVRKQPASASNLVLVKILVTIRRIYYRIDDLLRYFDPSSSETSRRSEWEHKLFVSYQSLDTGIFWNNLTFSSSVFRHSLRVSIACIVGFIIAKSIAYSHHSYWIIMTIAFILKPAFSLTKKRNFDRITGTIAGGVIGVIILAFIPNPKLQFFLMVLFMIGTYSFIRIRYLVSVICMTPFIFILFKFLGVGFITLAQERVLDTAIGGAIAFMAGYWLFPDWESEQLNIYFKEILVANNNYLYKLAEGLVGREIGIIEYRLARKNLYVRSANLSAAFQRMLSEPKNKQKNIKEIHQFVVLNHILSANIATIATSLLAQKPRVYPEEMIRPVKKALLVLCESIRKFDRDCSVPVPDSLSSTGGQNELVSLQTDDSLLKEQLEFIYRLCSDIAKITNIISGTKDKVRDTKLEAQG